MKTEIITIGDEILIGQIVDTNSAWMGEQLNLHGIEVYQVTSVHDDHDHILKALANAEKEVDLVLITGGLGPTKDDITKHCLCEYFNTELVYHPEVFEHVQTLLSSRNVSINQLNRDQALLPASCTVLHNSAGTASGMWFERNGTIFVSMPGVPFEMEAIMTEEVFPRLMKLGNAQSIVHKTILTLGLPESTLSEKIEGWESALPGFIKLAYLPSALTVRLRLSAYGTDKSLLEAEIEKQVKELQHIIPEYIFGFDDENMALVIGRMLVESSKTLAVAESCTGGNIAHSITSNAGSSAYFKGGVVAYSNEIKTRLLEVPPVMIETHGAVSQQVAEAMAVGVQKAMNADYSIATTGIAGPDGGTSEKPVGTIWIAVAGPSGVKSQEFIFRHNRERNIIRSTQTALNFLRKLILKDQSAK
ncbi:MAG TPA: competence/damage-inducible protein A [Prolixibacteraceae bacterium]|jgi:nicotinamide-nucleotide amidase|nr:competence/damage-inducible protein A [Prolixibacteraceae bacterium]